MEFLGLHYSIWLILMLYFVGMLLIGWWSRRGIASQEGYLLGKRQFGVPMMIMHAFGAGTHPGNIAGVMSETVVSGASGIWVSWMWLFGTPFYWIIAPIIRRMRCLTLADFFQERFSKAASVLYIIVATVGMVVFLASVLLATTRTVQGMMGRTSEVWFFGILFVTTVVFIIYSYWGGIIAVIRTDFIQGLMIIALSFLAIPAALSLKEVGGLAGMRTTLEAHGANYLSLFDPKGFSLLNVLLLCVNAPLTMLAFPHLMSVCGAGRTEWEGRVGFTYGNILKRVCTMGWCLLGLCWLVYLLNKGSAVHKDAAFGDSIRGLLSPPLQGVMLACMMAAAMASGGAVQVTVAGLFSKNIYHVFLNPKADQKQLVRLSRIIGVFITILSLGVAILMRNDLVRAILDYFNILGLVGIATAMGILWRRMNTTGMFCSTIVAAAIFLLTRHFISWSEADLVQQGLLAVSGGVRSWAPDAGLLQSLSDFGFLAWSGPKLIFARSVTVGLPLLMGITSGVIGSLITAPPKLEVIDKFFKKIYVPIGQEDKLELPLDSAVPQDKRWLTAGGLFIVKPSRQSWVGFVITLGICLACVLVMLIILK